jgi:hypothetical protein
VRVTVVKTVLIDPAGAVEVFRVSITDLEVDALSLTSWAAAKAPESRRGVRKYIV